MLVAIEVDVVPVDFALLAGLRLVVELDLLGTTALLVLEEVLSLAAELRGSAALVAAEELELHLHVTFLLDINLELGHGEVLRSVLAANLDRGHGALTTLGGKELAALESAAHDVAAAVALAALPLAATVLEAIVLLIVEFPTRVDVAPAKTTLVLGKADVVNVLGAVVRLSTEELLATESERRGDLSEASGGHQDEGVLHLGGIVVVCCCCR